jgi:hypothetical protein
MITDLMGFFWKPFLTKVCEKSYISLCAELFLEKIGWRLRTSQNKPILAQKTYF